MNDEKPLALLFVARRLFPGNPSHRAKWLRAAFYLRQHKIKPFHWLRH